MNRILQKYIDKFVIVYLDDIIIFSKTAEEHEQHVKLVLKALNDAEMILNLDKCTFFAKETKFLGHIISHEGSKPDPKNIEKVLTWLTPRTITEVRGFNNLAGHYRRYIDNFAELARPLTDLQKGSPPKGAAIKWTEREENAFQELKKALTSDPILKHADMTQPFILDPDSSQYIIGAVLQQEFMDPDGVYRLHPVAYESKKLTETEQGYSSQEREILAIKHALNHFRYFLEGAQVLVRTETTALNYSEPKKNTLDDSYALSRILNTTTP